MDVTATNPSFAQIKVKSEPGIARIGTTPSAVSTQLITAVQVRANVKYIPTHTCTFYTHTLGHTHTHRGILLPECMHATMLWRDSLPHTHTRATCSHSPTHSHTYTNSASCTLREHQSSAVNQIRGKACKCSIT